MCATASADHVEVREERQQRPIAPAVRDDIPDGVGLDLGHLADGLADDVEGELLVPRGPVRAQQAVEELWDGHVRAVYGRDASDRQTCSRRSAPTCACAKAPAASFLLESVEQGRLGRHSFIGSGIRLVSFEEAESARRAGRRLPRVRPHREARADGSAPRRRPGAAGEPLRRRRDTRPLRPRQRHGGRARRRRRRDRSAARKRACVSGTQSPLGALNHAADARSGRRTRRACERIREHIRAGDAFQVVLSQRAERPTSASALELYRALRRVNPSPYLFLLELGELALMGSSPETLVKCEDGRPA